MFCKSRKARCTQGPQVLGSKGASRLWAGGQTRVPSYQVRVPSCMVGPAGCRLSVAWGPE
jgi:hypothetical protein